MVYQEEFDQVINDFEKEIRAMAEEHSAGDINGPELTTGFIIHKLATMQCEINKLKRDLIG